jgi:uncharacterized integral membrane protein
MTEGDGVLVLALLIMIACSLYFGPRIHAERVAMQWGLDRKPVWSAPKAIALWALPVLAICIRMLVAVAERYAPDGVHDVPLGIAIMSLVVAGCHFAILRTAARSSGQS